MERAGEAEETRSALIRLAEALLQYYNVTELPVPIEQMLKRPPAGLAEVDLRLISSVMEHGLYDHEPRLAMARLLCREIIRSVPAMETLGVDLPPSISHADTKFFTRCLLMPAPRFQELVEQGLSVDQMGDHLQVPAYAVVTRLAEMGLPPHDTE